MTGNTIQSLVRAGQRKPCRTVVKCRRGPGTAGMAAFAVVVKIAALMVGIVSLRKIAAMTRKTQGRGVGIPG